MFTLRQAFDAHYLPDLEATAQPSTIRKYRVVLTLWERLTKDPPVDQIDNATLAAFRNECLRDGCRARRACGGNRACLAPITFNRAWTHIRSVLRRLAPQEMGNPQGLGILSRVPHIRLLKVDFAFPRIASVEEMGRFYSACAGATLPQTQIPPAEYWRALLVLLWNCGPRVSDIFVLRTSDIDFEKRQLRFVARKNKRAQVLPLNDTTIAHLKGIWSSRTFFFPQHRSVLMGSKGARQEFNRLQKIAAVEPRLTFQQLRKTCASQYDEHFGREVAAYILGHGVAGVTATWYVNPTRRIVDAVNRLPQPQEFLVPKVYCVAPPVRRTDFVFAADGAFYRGKRLDIEGRKAAALRAIVAAGRPLNYADLGRVVFWDRQDFKRRDLDQLMHHVRGALIRGLKLPEWHNPLPYNRTGDRGWTLVLPADIGRQMNEPGSVQP